jgi:hypothetical protein
MGHIAFSVTRLTSPSPGTGSCQQATTVICGKTGDVARDLSRWPELVMRQGIPTAVTGAGTTRPQATGLLAP